MSTKPRDVSWAQRRRRWQEQTAPSERRRRRRQEQWLDWRSSYIHSRPSRRSHHATCPDTQSTTNSRLFLRFRQVLSLQSSQRAQLEESSRSSEQPMDRPAPHGQQWHTTSWPSGEDPPRVVIREWRYGPRQVRVDDDDLVCSIFVCPFEKK